jgi:hypothetical protein
MARRNMIRPIRAIPSTVSIFVAALLLSGTYGCSIHGMTGDVMAEYAEEHMVPYLLAYGDTQVACGTGLAMGAFLNSFERVTSPPHKAAVPTLLSAATCAQERAWNAELDSLRAIYKGDAATAKDARIVEQRAHEVAARRLHEAYKRTLLAFPTSGKECPSLTENNDELIWLIGMLAVIQGVQHDRAVQGRVGIPLDAPVQAARGARCVNNQRWWGVPNAIKGAIWATLPGSGPKDADPWQVMSDAAKIGNQQGVRLAQAIMVQTAAANGKPGVVKSALKAFADSLAATPSSGQWLTLDKMAQVQARVVSDRIWTQAVGHRTPFGRLGALPEIEAPKEVEEDGLLDGL